MEWGVGGQCGDLGEMSPKGVVDGKGPPRLPHRYVDLQGGHELAACDSPVLGCDLVVALRGGELALRAGEGVHGHGRGERQPPRRVGKVAPPTPQGRDHLLRARGRLGHDLDLGGGKLGLEAGIALEARQHLARVRPQVEGLGIQQHHLLLGPHRQRSGAIEGRLQLLGAWVRHGPSRIPRSPAGTR